MAQLFPRDDDGNILPGDEGMDQGADESQDEDLDSLRAKAQVVDKFMNDPAFRRQVIENAAAQEGYALSRSQQGRPTAPLSLIEEIQLEEPDAPSWLVEILARREANLIRKYGGAQPQASPGLGSAQSQPSQAHASRADSAQMAARNRTTTGRPSPGSLDAIGREVNNPRLSTRESFQLAAAKAMGELGLKGDDSFVRALKRTEQDVQHRSQHRRGR